MIYGALVTFMSLFFSSVLPYDEAYQRVAYISALNAAIVMGLQYFVRRTYQEESNHEMGEVRCRVHDGRPDNFNLSVGPAVAYCGDRVAVLWRSGHCTGGVLIYYKRLLQKSRGVYLGAQNMIVLGLSISPVLCGYLLKEATASMMFAVLCIILVFSPAFYQMGYSVSEKAGDGLTVCESYEWKNGDFLDIRYDFY